MRNQTIFVRLFHGVVIDKKNLIMGCALTLRCVRACVFVSASVCLCMGTPPGMFPRCEFTGEWLFAAAICQLVLDPSVLLEILTHTQIFFAWNKLEIFGFLPRPPKLCF